MHFVAHFGILVQKQMEEIGSEKSTLWCPFDSGSGGLKLCGQCPYGNNALKKGLPYRPEVFTSETVKIAKDFVLLCSLCYGVIQIKCF